jgi:trehalose 6-phosphate phosphatase
MIPILSAGATAALDSLARERALLVFDFDGTLAPIVRARGEAAIPETTRALLRVVSLLYPCAVVSGRSRADLAPRLDRIPFVAIVGNHGAEAGFGPVDRSRQALVCGWREELRRALAGCAGVEVEDKGHTLAIHYRAAPDRSAARHRVRAVADALPEARVFGGRAVVNVVPLDAPNKGEAVGEVLRRIGWREALYVGDDATDEDAFVVAGVTVSVRVGRTHASAARYYLPQQSAIDELLRALVASRVRADGRERPVPGIVQVASAEGGARAPAR